MCAHATEAGNIHRRQDLLIPKGRKPNGSSNHVVLQVVVVDIHRIQESLIPKGRKPNGSSNNVVPQVVVLPQDTPQSWGSFSGTNGGREAIQ